jgi:hypothetical protein
LTKNGQKIELGDGTMKIKNKYEELTIDTQKGGLFYLKCNAFQKEMPIKKQTIMMDIMEAHKKYTHLRKGPLEMTAKCLGIALTGEWKVCDGCAQAKGQQEAAATVTHMKATYPSQHFSLATSGPYNPTVVGSKNWGCPQQGIAILCSVKW